MSSPIITVSNISYSYQEAGKEQAVLSDVSFALNRGECVALLGESGSGKSTLLNIIGGIDQASSGELSIQGLCMSEMSEPELTLFRREHLGFIYQLFNLIPTLTVFENIALPLELADVPLTERKKHVSAWLANVGLEGREAAFPDQLSGGEQQRVAVARALIHKPTIVLADEPTGNLDVATGQKVLSLLTTIAKSTGQTLLIVTHSKVVAEAADRVLVLNHGQISEGSTGYAW
ncbi:MAG: Putative ABC transport system ATP-binding protein [uncultured Thiotrichaceae bacterium]|uniref:ABC transport system ATP-binding protein n=1 Tax=uncultured Thiotrichaceae bacterium TaxID=298394 RepID=A0A6S6T7F6_9GAMM|nr:MAG: Putative ABC transport system ATP-binding protein [uncultured Thiotrichaceae bacterium]